MSNVQISNYETCGEIEIAIAKYFNTRINMIIPNVSWGIWGLNHECDLFILTKTGWAYEVEIKVSKSDLKADLKKNHSHSSKLLRKLYFAIPKKLELHIDLIPEHAGILVVHAGGFVSKIREARLNEKAIKITNEHRIKLGQLAAMRIWNLKSIINRHKQQQVLDLVI